MSVGGKVIDIVQEPDKDRVYINTDDKGDKCAIFVEYDEHSRRVAINDIVWWQGGTAYWTTADRRTFIEHPLKRLGCSGVSKPTSQNIFIE
ncbi:MAG: hypothetical protein GY814_02915 [Gammaproteobacteria bacterium]|nr:hypothetical protein [Gammaproteobacteria bacterium]